MNKNVDQEQNYCRKLGHFLTFEYCRNEQLSLPCRSIRNCWRQIIDIDKYLSENYCEQDIAMIFEPSSPKISSIIDLIASVQQVK